MTIDKLPEYTADLIQYAKNNHRTENLHQIISITYKINEIIEVLNAKKEKEM